MQAREANFLKFLHGPKQLLIPLYQRTYSWTRKQCEQLWSDVIRVSTDTSVPAHFIGSVVYIERGIYQATSVPQLLVIDGQQRLTTLSLLLAALARAIEAAGQEMDISARKINNYYLLNNDEIGDLHYKLVLTQNDWPTYVSLIKGHDLPPNASPRLVENYRYFQDQIERSGISLEKLFEGVGKLLMIDVSLDRQHDNPQLIFESMNSTGLDLSQADLIRNYVLMGLDPSEQSHLHNAYWLPMEQRFGHTDYVNEFDRFMRDYLTIKLGGTIPNIREVYATFKSYAYQQRLGGTTVEELVSDIYRYSKHFVAIAFLNEPNASIRDALADLKELRVEVANPFLMEVYDDYTQGLLSADELVAIIRLVESYVFRRAVVGIPTNSLNKTFATLAREIDKADYLQSARVAFWRKDSYKRFPRDDEFKSTFIDRDIYNMPRRMYVLRKLENHDRKEKVNVESYTIEHVMPQNRALSADWQRDLGPNWQKVQQQYLHTIGNLTLTGYNSEMSDRPFLQKRDMPGGFADSPLRLNRGLAKLTTWNADAILERAMTLAELAGQIWAEPALPAELMEQLSATQPAGRYTLETMEGHEYLRQGAVAELFQELRTRIMNLDPTVREEATKYYVAYKTVTNFVDVIPQKKQLRLILNMRYDELDDPRGLCRDITNIGRWGNGDVEAALAPGDDIDYLMGLIHQAYALQTDEMGAEV
jgi:uncharacterized protein with ParB-like and HNH nuclease domain/predicted transport protein